MFVLSDESGEERVPLSDIVRVRIYRVPASIFPAIRRAVLHLHSGKRIVLQSSHYVRLGTVEDRVETYRHVIGNLLQGIEKHSPHAEIVVGPPDALWITWLVLLVAACGVLVAALAVWIAGELPAAALFSLAIVIAFLPTAWRTVRAGRSRRAEARSLPVDALE
jgi:hypothetical protein